MGTTREEAALLYRRVTNRLTDLHDALFQSYRPLRVRREEWESQYASKSWDYLKGVQELAHYSVIVGYCNHFDQVGSILDVGCGEGILQERLLPCEYSRYVGIDISAEAIRRASPRQDDRTSFTRADATTYEPGQRFDVIIFNECMYYFEDPAGVLRKYGDALNDGGLVIVSMHVTEQSRRLWKALEELHRVEDEVVVTNRSGVSWMIKVLSPSGSSITSPPVQ